MVNFKGLTLRLQQSSTGLWSRSRSRIFLFSSESGSQVALDNFLHHTPKLGIPVEMAQFLLKLLLKQMSCCAPEFPLFLTAIFHSVYVKESESEILERSESGIGNLETRSRKFWKIGVGSFRKSETENLERSESGAEPDIFIWGATGGASFATRGAVNGLCRTFRKRPEKFWGSSGPPWHPPSSAPGQIVVGYFTSDSSTLVTSLSLEKIRNMVQSTASVTY